ncbi:MAG: hypothetical protein U0263_30240 [Polyangiaceae bacterium]
MTLPKVLRGIALGLLLAVLAVAVLTLRAVNEGEAHMKESDAAFDRGDLSTALLHARAACVMYAPGAPHVRRGYDRLMAIALGAEAAGQRRTADAAWRAVRSSALETRHAFPVFPKELARADEALARLARQSPDAPVGSSERELLERARADLARDDSPSAPWLVLLALGFAAALAGLGIVGFSGVTPEGKWALGRAKLGLLLSLAGAASWTLAVWRA